MDTAHRPIIRAPNPQDRGGWDPLWQGYLRFYRARLDPQITETTWTRLVTADEQPHGLVAELDGRIGRIRALSLPPSTWSPTAYCYLEDLFVGPETRGQGVARRLIEAVYAAADAAGATSVYWHTQEFNADGRALYDTLAHRTSFIVYQR